MLGTKQSAALRQPPTLPLLDNATIADAGGDYLRGERYLEKDLAAAVTIEPVVSGLKSVHDKMRTGFLHTCETLRMIDPTKTPQGHYLDVEKRFGEFVTKVAKANDTAREAALAELEKINGEIVARIKLTDGQRGAEIRTHFKTMDDAERFSAAMQAIEADDMETVGALLSGPAYLSKLTQQQADVLRTKLTEKKAADLLARHKIVNKSIATNRNTMDDLFVASGKLFPKDKVDDLRNAHERAKNARDLISSGW